jgi:hypothetical protein
MLSQMIKLAHTQTCATLKSVLRVRMANVNFTASVDRDLLRRAKVLAARHDTSISALLNAELRYLVETCELAEQRDNRNAALLLGFALGRISDLEAMDQLNLEHEEDLFLLMAMAHLPMPRLSDEATDTMVSQLQQLV